MLWGAAQEFAELVQPVEPAFGSSRPSQRYQVLDEHHVAEEDLPGANLVTAVIRLERIESPSDLVRAVDLLREWLHDTEDHGLRRAFADWVRWIAERLVPSGEELAAEMTLEDMRMTVVERVSKWPKQWVRQGREQGLREGRAEERALLERMAASRFGMDAAQHLSAVLAEITDPDDWPRWVSGWCAARQPRRFSPGRSWCEPLGEGDAGTEARGAARIAG